MSSATTGQNDTVAQIQDYATDPRLSRETKAFLKVLNSGGTPLESLTPAEAKQVLVNAQASVEVDLSGIEVSEKTITHGKYTVPLHVVRPVGVQGDLPVFLFIHGGGWVLGDWVTHERMVRDLVVLSGCAAVFVNYTRTPEAGFPQAINEIYAVAQWVRYHCREIGVDHRRMAIVGNSVGGNMATVTTLMAKEKKSPDFKLQILFWPIVDADFETGSYQQFGKDRFLTTPLMKWMYHMYIPDPGKRKDVYTSPLRATVDQLKGLPPALIMVAENDILRDEAEAYGRKLDEAGVPVATIRYNGMIHDFGLLNALAYLPQTRSLFVHAAAELKKYLCAAPTAGES